MSTNDNGTIVSLKATSRSRPLRDFVDLVSAIRFLVSRLTPLICIASAIGMVVKQHEPRTKVMNQLGLGWAEAFTTRGLTNVYSTSWFLAFLAFFVLFTSLCIARNALRVLRDLRNCKRHLDSHAQQAFHLHAHCAVVSVVHAWKFSASVWHEQRA